MRRKIVEVLITGMNTNAADIRAVSHGHKLLTIAVEDLETKVKDLEALEAKRAEIAAQRLPRHVPVRYVMDIEQLRAQRGIVADILKRQDALNLHPSSRYPKHRAPRISTSRVVQLSNRYPKHRAPGQPDLAYVPRRNRPEIESLISSMRPYGIIAPPSGLIAKGVYEC